MSTEQEQPTQAMDRLVDEVLTGRRVLVVAPGLWAFLLALFLSLAANAVLTSVIARSLAGEEPKARAIAHVVAMAATVALVVGPAACIVVGVGSAVQLVRRTIALEIACAGCALLLALGGDLEGHTLGVTFALSAFGAAYLLTGTEPYLTLALFRQRLRARRAVLLAVIRPKR